MTRRPRSSLKSWSGGNFWTATVNPMSINYTLGFLSSRAIYWHINGSHRRRSAGVGGLGDLGFFAPPPPRRRVKTIHSWKARVAFELDPHESPPPKETFQCPYPDKYQSAPLLTPALMHIHRTGKVRRRRVGPKS
eukprot:89846-Pelagomonas_calceolata.AAC.1